MNLHKIRRPSRYINSEINALLKPRMPGDVSFALAFPDIYDIGMSHLGLKILYQIINSLPFARAERAFHPWTDCESAMRAEGLRLATLETNTPLGEFDIVGMSLQYELCYTTAINMLSLAGIPIRAEERGERDPLVIAGGPCTANPAPVARFFDALAIGDAEDTIVEIAHAMHEVKTQGEGGREEALRALSGIEGVYVPSLHSINPGHSGRRTRRRIIPSLEAAPYPTAPIVPYTQIVHDRVNIEVARGCGRGCRFCQAGMIYRPVRERTPATALRLAEESLKSTGCEEISFTSLSAGDYSGLLELLRSVNRRFGDSKIAVSLPSLRVKSVNDDILKEIVTVKKTGFTIAPEAATERLRASINKDFGEEDYERALESLFKAGWLNLKLYYMVGLPGERDEDIEAIPPMVMKALRAAKRHTRRFVNLSVSASPFVPKAHTPYQWIGQAPTEELERKRDYLRRNLRKVNFRDRDLRQTLLEGAFARGDGRLGELVEAAHREGARLDAWSETFNWEAWVRAMDGTGVDAAAYATRNIAEDAPLPWDMVDAGIDPGFLKRELWRAREASPSPGCTDQCSACGLDCPPAAEPPQPAPRRRPMSEPPRPERRPIRVRARFSKTGRLAVLSHLELITHVTRALRRAGVRLEHTQGFHPTPKVSFGPPLGVGVEGASECFDMEITPEKSLGLLRDLINRELGPGVEILDLAPIGFDVPALQAFVKSYVYEIETGLAPRIEEFAARPAFEVKRTNDRGAVRTVDLRRMALRAELLGPRLALIHVRDLEDAGFRLEEFASAVFGAELSDLRVRRVALHGADGTHVPPFVHNMK